MIYFLWSLLNFAVFIMVICLCFRMFKPVQERYGTVLAVIMALALLSFTCSHDNSMANTKDKWQFHADTGKWYRRDAVSYPIHTNPMFTIHIDLSYAFPAKGSNPLPIEATAYVTGIESGIEWKPRQIVLNTDGHAINYEVSGSMEWRLPGVAIYTKAETYKGVIIIP